MRISQGCAHNTESDLKTYLHFDTVHVHISLCCLVEGKTRGFTFEAKLMLRDMALCNCLSLLQGLSSFLITDKANGGMVIGGNVRFNNTLIIHKELCLVKLIKWMAQKWRGLLCLVSLSLSFSITSSSSSSSTAASSINCLTLKVSACLLEEWGHLDMSRYLQLDG